MWNYVIVETVQRHYEPSACKPIHAVSQYFNGLLEQSPPQRGHVHQALGYILKVSIDIGSEMSHYGNSHNSIAFVLDYYARIFVKRFAYIIIIIYKIEE